MAESSGCGRPRLDRDALNVRWQAIETRLNQIAAAPGLDQELCRAEFESLLTEQDQIEYVLGLDATSGSRRWSGMA
jgi:hypothetical protein